MSIPQQKFRELVFQLLYSYDISKPEEDEMIGLMMKELSVTRKTVRSGLEKMQLIQEKLDDIDETIRRTTVSYSFDRIQTVERNILRLGIYEMLYDDTIPPKVAISESVRLARKFGTPESASFVNAIMDAIYKTTLGEVTDEEMIKKQAEQLDLRDENISEWLKNQPPQE